MALILGGGLNALAKLIILWLKMLTVWTPRRIYLENQVCLCFGEDLFEVFLRDLPEYATCDSKYISYFIFRILYMEF